MTACFLLTGRIQSVADVVAGFHAAGFSVDQLYPLSKQNDARNQPRHLLVSACQASYIGRSSFSLSKAKALHKLSKRLQGLDLEVEFLNRTSYSKIPQSLEGDVLQTSLGEPAGSDEVVLGELSARSFPSSVCLVGSANWAIGVRRTLATGGVQGVNHEN